MGFVSNIKKAEQILLWFQSRGVTDVIVCPGGRNAPLVVALEKNQHLFSTVSAFDERAAGFFAFGRAHSRQRPAVVITTSGTAAAELLPSVIEAHYTQTPLIVVTADRPHALRGTGSPQVIEQMGLFSSYVERTYDLDWNQDWNSPIWSGTCPLHLNISFEEPLVDAEPQQLEQRSPVLSSPQPLTFDVPSLQKHLLTFSSTKAVPLLIVGPLHPTEVESVFGFCQAWPGLIYAEASSGLRERGFSRQMGSSEKLLSVLLKQEKLSGVLRLGGVPTLKLWRELENSWVPVVSMSSRPFSGLARGVLLQTDFRQWPKMEFDLSVSEEMIESVLKKDRELLKKKDDLLKKFPLSEPAWILRISQQLSANEHVYVGNSLPLREWDDFSQTSVTKRVWVNRGANGIDGQLSSALGMCPEDAPLSVILGDLTALYDVTGLWFKDSVKALKVFVINNNGGRIFERIFNKSSFYNSHSVDFGAWAKMWKMKFQLLDSTNPISADSEIYEVVPREEQTKAFWTEYEQLFR